jgi:hypothetical protein
MWTYDGEEWIQDDGGYEPKRTPEPARPRYDEMMPELQVVEIVPLPPRTQYHEIVPLLPIP